jgi:hypothetical protein
LIGGCGPLIACVRLIANIVLMLLLLRRRRRWRRWWCGLLIVCVVTRRRAVMASLWTIRVTVSGTRGWGYTVVVTSRIPAVVARETRRGILNVHRHQVGAAVQERHVLGTTRAGQGDGADFLRLLLHR